MFLFFLSPLQTQVMSSMCATRLCWSGPSGRCGWCWRASIRCGFLCIAPGVWTSATTAAWLGWTRPRRRPSTERSRWRSGGARTTSRHLPWSPSTTSTPASARWISFSVPSVLYCCTEIHISLHGSSSTEASTHFTQQNKKNRHSTNRQIGSVLTHIIPRPFPAQPFFCYL